MALRVTVFCPDRHLVYDARTAEDRGVGGGVTARLRMAQALARRGHRVRVVANVPRAHRHRRVWFDPLDGSEALTGDVLVVNSSGGALDVGAARGLERGFRRTEVWVQGVPRPRGLEEVAFDHLVVPSNFIRRVAHEEWGVAPERLFVAYNGVEARLKSRSFLRRTRPRDPFRLVYTSHPSKGLETALVVLAILRSREPRFRLHVYGSAALWGGAAEPVAADGVVDHGLVGQRRLSRELERSSVALHLQAFLEGNSLVLQEAMAAGNLVLASPLGPNGEVIRHGHDGFLVPGPHQAAATREAAASLIEELVRRPDFAEHVRRNARAAPLDWDELAAAWEGRWRWALSGERRRLDSAIGGCAECRGPVLPLADGYHCTACGWYGRGLPAG